MGEHVSVGCPDCGTDLETAEISIIGTVAAKFDPQGKDKIDVLVTCGECGTRYNFFVAVADMVQL